MQFTFTLFDPENLAPTVRGTDRIENHQESHSKAMVASNPPP